MEIRNKQTKTAHLEHPERRSDGNTAQSDQSDTDTYCLRPPAWRAADVWPAADTRRWWDGAGYTCEMWADSVTLRPPPERWSPNRGVLRVLLHEAASLNADWNETISRVYRGDVSLELLTITRRKK